MTDSATIPAERRGNLPDSIPANQKYLYYYWSAALDDLCIPAMPLRIPAVSPAPEEKVFDASLRRPGAAEIEKRLHAAQYEGLLLLLRAGGFWQ